MANRFAKLSSKVCQTCSSSIFKNCLLFKAVFQEIYMYNGVSKTTTSIDHAQWWVKQFSRHECKQWSAEHIALEKLLLNAIIIRIWNIPCQGFPCPSLSFRKYATRVFRDWEKIAKVCFRKDKKKASSKRLECKFIVSLLYCMCLIYPLIISYKDDCNSTWNMNYQKVTQILSNFILTVKCYSQFMANWWM